MTQQGGRSTDRADAGHGDWKYDLAVAYRIYPKVSKTARSLPFGDDKLRQAEICLRSFRNSLGSIRVKIWAILDGCPGEYRALFERYFGPKDLVSIEVNEIGNQATFAKQINILLSQRDAEFVYFAEDDYLYLPARFPVMLNFLRDREEVDFVTPYDHPDCYLLELHREPEWVTVYGGHHWRTAASTCLTFLTRRATLARYERVFRTYSRGNDDCSMWLSLTKRRVFSPLALLRSLSKGEFCWSALVKSWLFCWPQVVFGKTLKLWAPVPGLATHYCAGLLSPGIDWLLLMRGEAASGGPSGADMATHTNRLAIRSLKPVDGGGRGQRAHVVVLVLNWNNWRDTNECLESLRGLDYDDWNVIVLDNGSTDGSVERIRERFPEVEIMELGENLGFAGGNNAGIRAALQRGAEYVWLLNNDTTVDPEALVAMVEKAETDPTIGAVGSAIYHTSEPQCLQAWGGGYVNFWLGRSRHFVDPVPDEKLQFLTGASLLLRRSALESVGFLDEDFFLYWEDADYCFRLRTAGWRLAVAGGSKVWHKQTATTGKNSARLDWNFNKSAKRFFRKHFPLPVISICAGIGCRIGKRAIRGDWERVRAVWAGAWEAETSL
jgi:GT2 family glycosyltransferase